MVQNCTKSLIAKKKTVDIDSDRPYAGSHRIRTGAYRQRRIVADKFLNIKEVSSVCGMSKSWIYEEIEAGRFPKQVELGTAARWSLNEILSWMQSQLDSREAA